MKELWQLELDYLEFSLCAWGSVGQLCYWQEVV